MIPKLKFERIMKNITGCPKLIASNGAERHLDMSGWTRESNIWDTVVFLQLWLSRIR